MSDWHTVRIRGDLFWQLQSRARQQSRSIAGQLDYELSGALERESGNLQTKGEVPEAERRSAQAPVRAPLEGQTTVQEMLASCPNCAETLQSRDGVLGCLACGYVRETTS